MIRKVLLVCGIAASLLYIATTILGAMAWEGYSSIDQTVSELFAIDAPSRFLVIPLFLAYGFLMIAFGLGVWESARGKQALRIVGGLMVVDQLRGFAGTLLAPIHLRGVEGTSSDIWHIILTSATVLLILVIIGLGATAFGKRFRLYSIGTILVLIVFGALTGLDGPRMAANLPTPWMGVGERINIFGYLLWVAVLAIGLLRASVERPQEDLGGGRATAPRAVSNEPEVMVKTGNGNVNVGTR